MNELRALAAQMAPHAPELARLAETFGLGEYAQHVLLAALAYELDGTLEVPLTVGALLEAFPDAHWSAWAPDAPLRAWELVVVDTRHRLAAASVRLDECVLQALLGNPCLDVRLARVLKVCSAALVAESQAQTAQRIAEAIREGVGLVQAIGTEPSAIESVAAEAARRLGMPLYRLDAGDLAQGAWLWSRQTRLASGLVLIDGARPGAVEFCDQTDGTAILAGHDRFAGLRRASATFAIDVPTPEERRAIWELFTDEDATGVAQTFRLGPAQIREAALEARLDGGPDALWNAARRQNRGRLDELAERIETGAHWEDLVLPEESERPLRDLERHVRGLWRVYQEWGFGGKQGRGLGITALFTGPSGTGKTLGAEVVAHALQMDLYRVDLSRVVSKYIGETEKNLRRIFDAAERGGVVLLFDEADALFGKRSEVKDSHDRYANIEVSYLLQRMEQYQGLAILTTNLKSAFDPAFLRRIRFIVPFPFPEIDLRARIWERSFPEGAPQEGLDTRLLAQLNVPGGNIRNIALNAAFRAADAGTPIRMEHLRAAAAAEYAKLERPLAEAEVKGW